MHIFAGEDIGVDSALQRGRGRARTTVEIPVYLLVRGLDFFGHKTGALQSERVVFVEIEKRLKMAREGAGFLGAGAERRSTAIGAFPPVLGIFCAPARPRGCTRTTGA